MNAREICERYNCELVSPAELAERYGLELDCPGLTLIEKGEDGNKDLPPIICLADENNLAILFHEIAHVLFPDIEDHRVIVWLGILLQTNERTLQ